MSVLSANTLFHFTNKDALLSILTTGFKFFYCKEFGESMGKTLVETSVPMISLCDIPLSKLDKHINGYSWEYNGKTHYSKKYGKFGIGMTKEWGKEKKFGPLTYVLADDTRGSAFLEQIMFVRSRLELLDRALRLEVEQKLAPELVNEMDSYPFTLGLPAHTSYQLWFAAYESLVTLNNTFGYIKPYKDSITGQTYYDEREWRLIPFHAVGERPANKEVPIIYHSAKGDFPVHRHKLNEVFDFAHYKQTLYDNYNVDFTANDIKYIVVEDEKDIKDIVAKLQDISRLPTSPIKYTQDEIIKLTSRILTSRQIQEDL